MSTKGLTHVAGNFLIFVPGSFLNGAGLGEGEDRNVTVPKTFWDGHARVPYVSAQAWRRWLRNTLIEETGWPKSELVAIKVSEKGTVSKIAGKLNPVEYAEDDIFGYMRAEQGQGRTASQTDDEEEEGVNADATIKGERTKAVMRTSPFMASLLISIRRGGTGRDEAFVHLTEGTPLPYTTEFYNGHLEGVFDLNYNRLGTFRNVGDRIELDEQLAAECLKSGKIKVLEDLGKSGKIYEMTDRSLRKQRGSALLKAFGRLRGGAKQAQFGTDISPKALIVAGLASGNPIFNGLFRDNKDGPILDVTALKEIISDYKDRIVTPVYVGIRKGYLSNETEVRMSREVEVDDLGNNRSEQAGKIVITTPIEAADKIAESLS